MTAQPNVTCPWIGSTASVPTSHTRHFAHRQCRSGPTRERMDVRPAARQLPAEPVAFELAPDPEDLAAESELEPSNAE